MRTVAWPTCCWRNRISSSWPTRSPDSCSSTSSGPSSELGSGPSPFPWTGIGRGRGGRFPARPEPWSEPYSPTSFRSFSFISSWRSKPNFSKFNLFWKLWNKWGGLYTLYVPHNSKTDTIIPVKRWLGGKSRYCLKRFFNTEILNNGFP